MYCSFLYLSVIYNTCFGMSYIIRLGRYSVQFQSNYFDPNISFDNIFIELSDSFPGFKQHLCCHDIELESESDHNIVKYGNHMDIPHLLEHLVIEILSFLEPEQRLTCTTCQYENDKSKFDIFINVRDPQIALFAFHIAWSTISSLLYRETLTQIFKQLVQIAAYIINFHGKNIPRPSLQNKFDYTAPIIEQALVLLEEFSLISEYNDEEILI